MNEQSARRIVAALVAAFPSPEWPAATLELYASEFARLDDVPAAGDTVAHLIRTARFRPTIAEILDVYHAMVRARAARERKLERERAAEMAEELGLPAPPSIRDAREPIPDAVVEWMRKQGIDVDGIVKPIAGV